MAERLNNDFQFLDVARQDPEKKDLTVRKAEFVEIYKPFTADIAANQTHRCLGCGNPYCEWKCPVHNYIPNWLKLIAEGRIALTLELLSPAQRPLQITRDLSAFWKGSYRDVQKEMKGRYPKHVWPDDPASALPTRRTKKYQP